MRKQRPIELEGICYVLPQAGTWHKIAEARHDLVWYPEQEMSMFERVNYRPYAKSIVTEDPWIIACYDQDNVRIWKDDEWRWPNSQTYGASVNNIYHKILHIPHTIPSCAMDGGKAVDKLLADLTKSYEKSQRREHDRR
jgi:hypothetical protein